MGKSALSDEELWYYVANGDDKAFGLLYDRYWLQLYKAALYFLKDRTAAEEVVQEVFVLIWSKRSALNIQNFAAYLNATTRYEVYRKLEAAKQSILEYREDCPPPENVAHNKGYEKLMEIDRTNALAACLKDLPKRCRDIYYLSKIENLSNTEIADRLGISKHTVENQLAIAVKHVRLNFGKVVLLYH